MTHLKKFSFLTMALALGLGFTSCDKDDVDPPAAPQQKTIAGIASDNPDFSILVDALSRTNLVDAVNDPNANLTIFAPTNAAFADLLAELNLADLDAVEAALGNDGLKNVLLYHVLGAEVKSNMVEMGYASTLATNGTNDALSFFISTDGGVKINDRAMVTDVDIDASNGVIHVIDKVILPVSVFELLKFNAKFSSLVTALTVADGDLDDLLMNNAGPFTLFAPDNDAFGDLLVELNYADLNAAVAALGTDGLADVLTYHVVSGNINSDEVPSGSVTTVNGGMFMIDLTSGVNITDANARMSTVTQVDIQGTNGVIHVVNTVMLP